MKIVTFGGNFSLFPLMKKYDLVLCDKSFNYPNCPENAEIVDSGIVGEEIEKRRIRIAKMLLYALEKIDDSIQFVDTDVYIPEQCIHEEEFPFNFLIYARWKPSDDINYFPYSTNIFIPKIYRERSIEILKDYLNGKFIAEQIDINLSWQLQSKLIICNGVIHYIDGKPYVIRW